MSGRSYFLAIFLVVSVFLSMGHLSAEEGTGSMQITSPAFKHNEPIPSRYTCEGLNINPELAITGIPKGAKSLALIVDDPDAPAGLWVHWVVFNIPVMGSIKENSVPGTLGITSSGSNEYHGPCPPKGTHRYFFKAYALDAELVLDEGLSKPQLESAMQGHILDRADLIGLYQRGK